MQLANSENTWKQANRVLICLIVLCNLYIVVAPLLPQLQFILQKIFPVATTLHISADHALIDRTKDHLIIPDLRVDVPVGLSQEALAEGAWLRPTGNTPDKGGNTVLAGHRFAYGTSTPFYHLDKLQPGAEVAIVHQGKLYRYVVDKTYVAQPSQKEVEQAESSTPKLTMYTCTPLFTAKERLVVEATLKEIL